MQNEKNVRENPTKLEYVLRCFLKVKAICKNKKKCSGSGADVSVHKKNPVCSPYPGTYDE